MQMSGGQPTLTMLRFFKSKGTVHCDTIVFPPTLAVADIAELVPSHEL